LIRYKTQQCRDYPFNDDIGGRGTYLKEKYSNKITF